jgi:endonuclease/exonuclease/phosphatase family metal-dependent hydrolase
VTKDIPRQNLWRSKPLLIGLIAIMAVMLLISSYMFTASQIGEFESCLVECTQFPREHNNEFLVMNLNMLHGYPDFEHLSERLDLIAEQVKIISPEFVTLQEVPWTRTTRSAARYLAEETGMNYVYLPANGNRWTIFFEEGVAILSKFPLKDVEFVELFPRAEFFEHRVALKTTAVAPWGKIHIVSTHLTNGDPKINQLQAQNLYQYVSGIKDGNVIVAGDFNATENSPQIKFLDNEWIDTYRKVNPYLPGFTCCVKQLIASPVDNNLEKRIDFIFMAPDKVNPSPIVIESQRVMVLPYWVGNQQLWASDHIGVLSKFRVLPQIDGK